MLFAVCGSAIAADTWVDRIAGISPDTYVDFPVRAGGAVEVVISNDCADASSHLKPLRLKAPGKEEGTVLLGFRRYRGRLSLYLDSRLVHSEDDIPGLIHLLVSAESLPEEKGDAYVQSLAPFTFADAFMVAEEDKTGLQSWEKLAGDWTLHAVTGRTVRADDKGKLSRYPTQARSPNFYCLNGFGANALITAGESFYSHYSIRASLQENGGTNGIAFLISEDGAGYTFTTQPNPRTGRLDFVLRSGCVAGESAGEFVAGAETELTPGQWYMLEARITEDEIICYVDDVAIVRKALALPAGGRFGLYSNTLEAHPARFDDVVAETWTGVDFALADNKPNRSANAAFGTTNDPPASISLRASIQTGRHMELQLGDDGQGNGPDWRLLCESVVEDGPRLRVSLIGRTAEGLAVTNDTWISDVLPAQTGAEAEARELTLDATAPGFVAGRVDNVTVVIAHVTRPPVGRAGYVTDIAPESRRGGFLGHPSVTREPSPYTDRFEKNKIFVSDQFMRHWASTAGQWLTYTNGTAWYKDDVLNRVSLSFPTIDGLDLRLGVPETDLREDGRPESTFICDIRVVCADGKLSILDSAATNAAPLFTLGYPPAQMVGENGDLNATNTVTLRFDGHRLAFSSATGSVFTCSIPYPHTGRRMYFAQHPNFYLGNVLVHREPVLDCLFDESLHDWTINGGTWEIINRFQCYPDWSHMDGENPDSVAALWSKYEIGGDFCATFVCGMRHGGPWYDRVGDFNLTLFNKATTPSEGYTLKVTDWDPNNSQRWSRLFRNGKLVVKTDVKAAPRRREGNVRTGYEPLVAKGRDVHGAWYTVKFRKLGNRLEAFFDNLPLLSTDDLEPLSAGGLGIWTYRSSMVVARVRVTAERIAPRQFVFKPLSAAPSVDPPSPSPLDGLGNISFNDVPADLLRPELWHAADDVSSPEITFGEEGDETVMTVNSIHGSGSFLAAPILPETTVDKLAGWTFEIARSPDAQFNFVFSLAGRGYTNQYSHVICGSDEHRGPRALIGQSPTPNPTEPGVRKKVWTPVTVWIPATGNDPRAETVIFQGFGNLQPSDIQQGLHGNGPGAWYSVRRLHPIYRGTPTPDNASDNTAAFSADITRALDKGKAAKLNSFKVSSSACKTRPTIYWTLPPADNPGLIATVLAAPTNAIRIASSLEWPNPIICVSNVTVNGAAVPHAYVRDNSLIIPYARPFDPSASSIVKVSFTTENGRPFTQMIPSSSFARPSETPERAPVVTDVKFPPSLAASYENFESRTTAINPYTRENTKRELRYGDEAQSTYLHFHNAGRNSRLSGTFANQFDITRTPLLQFRYRGDDMALVNIFLRQNTSFHFSDNYGGQERPAKLDDEWHTAFCRLTAVDFETRPNFIFQKSQNQLFFTSSHISVPGIPQYHINQTGLFSYFDIDDVALGPAIGPAYTNDFRFHAAFDAPDGLGKAQYAIVSGDATYDARPDNERNSIAWTDFDPADTNGVAPAIGKIANGMHHLLIRALSPAGSQSAVADIPFLYDDLPPDLSFDLSTNSPTGPNDAMLTTTAICGPLGAAPLFTNAIFTANGTKLQPFYLGTVNGKADNSVSFAMKWPYVARNIIQACTNGATIRFRVENIADGAGNVAPPIETTYKLDFASDKTPPLHSPSLYNIGLFHGKGGFPTREAFFTHFVQGIEAGRHVYTNVNGMQSQSLMLKVVGDPNQKDAPQRIASLQFQNWIAPTNRWLMLRARVPEKTPAPTGVVFRLAFLLNATPKAAKTPAKNNRYVLEVPASNSTNDAARPAGLRGNTDFTPGKWVELAIDVGAFLNAKAGMTDGAFKIERLALILPPVKGGALELDAAAVVKHIPIAKRSLDFNAYDVSGIDGLYIDDTKISEGGRIMLDKLYEQCGTNFFADIRVRDRAGNITPMATIIPLPPRD